MEIKCTNLNLHLPTMLLIIEYIKYEKLAINDHKIVLAKSWDTLGMARLGVCAW